LVTNREFYMLRHIASFALVATLGLGVASTASAGRLRPVVPAPVVSVPAPIVSAEPKTRLPATPEPGAALAFGAGIGLIAWAARRRRNG
jgi:hypothetical protein